MEEKEKKKRNTGTKKKKTVKKNVKTSNEKVADVKKTMPKKTTLNKEKEPVKEEKKVIIKEEIKTPAKKKFEVDYLTIVILVIAVLCAFIASAKLFGQEKKDYKESYLVKNKIASQISCSDIPNALQGEKSYIFITTVGSEEEYMLEKRMATIIQDKGLKDDFYVYLYEENCHPSTMKLTEKPEQIPSILYYRDGNLTEKVMREDKTMLQDGDLARIVDIYEE